MYSISCSKYFWKAFGQSLRRSIPSSANFIGEKKEKEKERKEMLSIKEELLWLEYEINKDF